MKEGDFTVVARTRLSFLLGEIYAVIERMTIGENDAHFISKKELQELSQRIIFAGQILEGYKEEKWTPKK